MKSFRLTTKELTPNFAALALIAIGLVGFSHAAPSNTTDHKAMATMGFTKHNGFKAQGVNIKKTTYLGREAMEVELTDEIQQQMNSATSGFGNLPTYAISDETFTNGTIEVDVAGEINGKGAPDVRAFVGVAFHLSPRADTYEAVYLRMTNGTLNNPPPPPPRNTRAIQYVAHPDFHFNVSREKFPNRYEASAPIALGRWHRLRLDIHGANIKAYIDETLVLEVTEAKYAGRKGQIGLWVDDGTRAYFSGLRIIAQ